MPIKNLEALRAMNVAVLRLNAMPHVPMEQDLMEKYPDVDPMEKFSETEMELARRLDAVKANYPYLSPDMQELADQILDSRVLFELWEQIREKSYEMRECLYAKGLCENSEGEAELQARIDELKQDEAIKKYTCAMEILESITGLRSTDPNASHTRFLKEVLGIDRDLSSESKLKVSRPRGPHFELMTDVDSPIRCVFPNQSHMLLQKQACDPLRWEEGTNYHRLAPGIIPQEQLQRYVEQFAVGHLARTMEPMLRAFQDMGKDPASFILIGSETAAELWNRSGLAGDSPEKKSFLLRAMAAALTAGKPVSMYRPLGRNGAAAVSDKPVPVVAAAPDSQPVPPYVMSAWERFWSHFGFYTREAKMENLFRQQLREQSRLEDNDLTARMKELYSGYKEHQNALRSMENNLGQITRLDRTQLEEEQKLRAECSTSFRRSYEMCYSALLEGQKTIDSLIAAACSGGESLLSAEEQLTARQRGMHRPPVRFTPAAFITAALLEKGFSLREILDPGQLKEEKAAAGQALRKLYLEGDNDLLADKYIQYTQDLCQKFQEELAGMDVENPEQVADRYPHINALGAFAWDLYQECTVNPLKGVVQQKLGAEGEAFYATADNLNPILFCLRGQLSNPAELYLASVGELPLESETVATNLVLPSLVRRLSAHIERHPKDFLSKPVLPLNPAACMDTAVDQFFATVTNLNSGRGPEAARQMGDFCHKLLGKDPTLRYDVSLNIPQNATQQELNAAKFSLTKTNLQPDPERFHIDSQGRIVHSTTGVILPRQILFDEKGNLLPELDRRINTYLKEYREAARQLRRKAVPLDAQRPARESKPVENPHAGAVVKNKAHPEEELPQLGK